MQHPTEQRPELVEGPPTPTGVVFMNFNGIAGFIWSVADLLRGDYKQSEYGKIVLPFTLLRRLDCVLEATKPAVLAEHRVPARFARKYTVEIMPSWSAQSRR